MERSQSAHGTHMPKFTAPSLPIRVDQALMPTPRRISIGSKSPHRADDEAGDRNLKTCALTSSRARFTSSTSALQSRSTVQTKSAGAGQEQCRASSCSAPGSNEGTGGTGSHGHEPFTSLMSALSLISLRDVDSCGRSRLAQRKRI